MEPQSLWMPDHIRHDGSLLSGNAYWRNVPATVWRYKLGGYQEIPEEVMYFAEVARRVGGIVVTTDTPGGTDHETARRRQEER